MSAFVATVVPWEKTTTSRRHDCVDGVGGRRHLPDLDGAVGLVQDADVRERAPNVDCDAHPAHGTEANA